jgi:catechol 2,3-dioxygenase-like lactoylglutathione lyase family enzyme
MALVNGVHLLIYSPNPDADRAFLRDVLGFKYVDVGHGWLIFGMPPAEAACHPLDPGDATAQPHGMLDSHVYLMCDDLDATIAALAEKGVNCTAVQKENWGVRTTIRMPSGGEIGLYQPRHPVAYNLR